MSGREVGTIAGGRLPVGHYNGGELRRGSGIEQAERERERERRISTPCLDNPTLLSDLRRELLLAVWASSQRSLSAVQL